MDYKIKDKDLEKTTIRDQKYDILKERALERVKGYEKRINESKFIKAIESVIEVIKKYPQFFESEKYYCGLTKIGTGVSGDLKLQSIVDLLSYSAYKGMDILDLELIINDMIELPSSGSFSLTHRILERNGPKDIKDYYNFLYKLDFDTSSTINLIK